MGAMAVRHLRVVTQWVFFLFAIVVNLALVYEFVPPRNQWKAVGFLAVVTAATGAYVVRARGFHAMEFVSRHAPAVWGKPAVFKPAVREQAGAGEALCYAVWRKEGHAVWLQRRLPKNGIGKSGTAIVATLAAPVSNQIVVYRRTAAEDLKGWLAGRTQVANGIKDFGESFIIRSLPAEFGVLFLDAGTRDAIETLGSLEDPLHQLYVSLRDRTLIISLDGELEDKEAARAFTQSAFRLVERSIELVGSRAAEA